MHSEDQIWFTKHLGTNHSLIPPPCTFPLMSTLEVHTKYQILRHPFSTVNGMTYYTERHSLLMKYLKTFLICIRQMEGACDCIQNPLMDLMEPLFTMINLQIAHKRPAFKVPSQYAKWNDILQGETPIAYEVFQNLWQIYNEVGGTLQSIYKPLIGLTMRFSTNVESQIEHKIMDF